MNATSKLERRTRSARTGAFTGVLLGGLALVGCEGSNAFEPGGGVVPPTGEDVTAPSVEVVDPEEGETFLFGDTLIVSADISDNQAIGRVTFEGFTVRGDPALGEDSVIVIFEPNAADLEGAVSDTTGLQRRLVPRALPLDSATVSIVVTAVDGAGNEGADTVQILMGSSSIRVTEPTDGAEVFAGGNPFTVEAVDPGGVRELLFIVEADGAAPDTSRQVFDPAVEEAVFQGSFPIPSGVAGEAELFAVLRNVTGDVRVSDTLTVSFDADIAVDEIPPEVRFVASVRSRAELTDSVRIIVESRDPTPGDGLARAAVSLWATNALADTVQVVSDTVEFTTAPRASTDTFHVALDRLVEDVTDVPDTIRIRVVAWAEDLATLCGAAVEEDTFQSLECTLSAGAVAADGQVGFPLGPVTVVPGRTSALPGGGRVADLAWDTLLSREQVAVANLGLNQIQFVDVEAGGFLDDEVLVPAPWGLAFDRADSDRLYSANSGGTNISVVDVPALEHLVAEQILTPNEVLWEVVEQDNGCNLSVRFLDFSDRPQFLAVDEFNNFVYSTRPTSSAPDGTIRLVNRNVSPDLEVIFYTDYATPEGGAATAIDRADNVFVSPGLGDFGCDLVVVEDHFPGDTSSLVRGEGSLLGAAGRAVGEVQAQIGEDGQPRAFPGAWDLELVGLSDTTFLAASGDGTRVAIGEGNTGPTGRIMLYSSGAAAEDIGSVSDGTRVLDLTNNASERVFGLAMSYDGFFGAARGDLAAYFFDEQLRLQISFEVETGGAGIALHPLHVGRFPQFVQTTALAFVGNQDNSISIYDTRSGSQVGGVLIRDRVTGVMKATLPMSFDNQGLTCVTTPIAGTGGQEAVDWTDPATDDLCVVVKLAAVTENQGVLVVNVTKADFTTIP